MQGDEASRNGDVDKSPTPFGIALSLEVFDRTTRFARKLFTNAQSLVVLVKDGKAWRSRLVNGVYPPHDPVAELVIATGQLLWVADAREDSRFQDYPSVAGPPFIRGYIGAPIRLKDGSTPGVLAVFSTDLQPFDRTNAERLEALAAFVADEWERAQVVHAHRLSTLALTNAETTLEALVEAVPTSLVLTDRDLKVVAASRLWAQSLALRPGSYIGKSLYDLAPDLYEPNREAFDKALAGQPQSTKRTLTRLPIGIDVWLQTDLKPWRNATGEIGGVALSSSDVTELAEALDRSERSEERLTLAMQLADIHVWEMDYARRELIKVGAEDTFFERPQTFEGLARDIYSGLDPRDRDTAAEAWRQHQVDGKPYHTVYRMNRTDGKEVWAQGAARLFSGGDGRPLRLIGALQNITDRKRVEFELIQARNDAEAANTAKSTFLATMSHEIRTPLNGVLGMAQAMAADDLAPVQRERLSVIRQSGEALLAVLNDVLDLSKIEAGRLDLEESDFDLRDLARGAHAAFSAVAETQGLSFDLTIEDCASGVYRGDPARVRQILYNLISNALKFTERGAVTVVVSRPGGKLSFKVSDTGIGIAPGPLARLFGRFEQADASTSRRYGGTGLGLAICRQLTELMGGTIGVESEPGSGTTFTVILPLLRVAESQSEVLPVTPPTPEDSEITGDTLKVLAAEDNEVNQLVLKTLLQQVGITPVIVTDGAQALAAWEAEAWDVILMDVQMPEVDGPTASRAIRKREAATGRSRTPIIALTANAMSHQVAEYRDAGMDGFVAKPIEVGRLFAALEAALASPAGDDAATG